MRPPYPAKTMHRAVELREAGWTPTETVDRLDREGLGRPSLATIYAWTNPDYYARRLGSVRRSHARRQASKSAYRFPGDRTPEWRLGRIRVLASIGLSCADIAKVMSHDFPDTPLTRHQIEHALKNGSTPRSFKKAMTTA